MSQLITQFKEIRLYSEQLCVPLNKEDFIPQRSYFASPPKWHLAHVTWFFEMFILKEYSPNYRCFQQGYEFLFNSYYNAMGERLKRDERGLLTRPSVDEIYQYRAYVNEHIESLLINNSTKEIENLVVLGLNHEQQHQELLLTDLKHTFAGNPTYPVYQENFDFQNVIKNQQEFIIIPEGIYNIGYNDSGFYYDNEKGYHKVFLHEYEIASELITHKLYLDFINDGGYETSSLWLDDGWSWVQNNNITAPEYWLKRDNQWYLYTLSGIKPLPLNTPVCHISHYEADAFARWYGMRLPTEFEWEVAADKFNWGQRWEWTNSAYLPYPKFAIAEGAVGEYNGKFMSNQMVLRGASEITSPQHSRKTYRNFFYPEQRWQYTGIRVVRS